MTDSSADRDPLERLAEEFVGCLRAGQRPSLAEYAQRHPELADQIRDLFPALVEMEQLKPVSADHTGAFVPAVEPTDPERIGEFRILRRVGYGGMGVVYEALQESLGRHVALKVLPIDALADPKRLERFRREAKAAARLHHTNIVPVFGTGEAGGRHFYAMQFIVGHPLDAVIDEVRRLKEKSGVAPAPRPVSGVAAGLMTGTFAAKADCDPVSREGERPESSAPPTPAPGPLSGSLSDGGRHYFATVARLGAQVADALAYAHAQGILHRDIKPANLLLDLRGTVWVTDFGLAKTADADDLTRVGDIVGTLRYMAPERFDGPGDSRSDVYGLGLTLYELLTLKPAFVAESRAKLVQEVTAAAPPKPRSINRVIPRDLETIVLKATARDPAMRYQSASELADDLGRFTRGETIAARPAGLAERVVRWVRRKPTQAGLYAATAAVAVLLTFAVTVGLLWRDAESAREQLAGEKEQTETARDLLAEEQKQTKAALGREAATRKDAEDARDKARRAEGEANRARDALALVEYSRTLDLANRHVREGDLPRARELLHGTRADLRGWEWNYLNRSTQQEVMTIHTTGVHLEIQFRPDGKRFSTLDGRLGWGPGGKPTAAVVTWDADTGTQIRSRGVTEARSFSRSSDLRRLVTVQPLVCTVQVSETEADTESVTFPRPGQPPLRDYVQSAVLSPDARELAVVTNTTVRVWDVESGEELADLAAFRGIPRLATYLPDGWRVVTTEARMTRVGEPVVITHALVLRVHDLTGKVLAEAKPPRPRDLDSVYLSPDGKRVVVFYLGAIDEFSVLDLTTGKEVLNQTGLPGRVPTGRTSFGVVISPDGRRLVVTERPAGVAQQPLSVTGFPSTWVWDAETGPPPIPVPDLHLHPTTGMVVFSPDGRRLATTGSGGEVCLWSAETGARLVTLPGHRGGVKGLRFSPDGRRLVSTGVDRTIRVWDVGPREQTLPLPDPNGWLIAVGPTPGGVRVVTRWAGNVTLLDPATGRTTVLEPGVVAHSGAFDAAGRRLVTSHHDKVRVWDTATGALLRELKAGEEPYEAYRVAVLSPDGRLVAAVATGPKLIRIWEVDTGRLVIAEPWQEANPASGPRLRFTPDGRLVLATRGKLAVFDVRSRQWVAALSTGPHPQPKGGGFSQGGLAPPVLPPPVLPEVSPDGSLILLPGAPPEVAAAVGLPSAVVAPWPQGCTGSPVFNPDGRRLAGFGPDGTVQIWDVASGRPLLSIPCPGSMLAFSSDGRNLVVAGENGVRIFDSAPAEPVVVPVPVAPPPRAKR